MSQSVAATFVFTDLVGSTALSAQLGASEAEDLRRQHFSVLRAAVDATGGREVKNLGDGLMVVFLSPSRALACAVAMQQGMERRNGREHHALSVRIGLAIGEATEDEGDFFGDPVVEAARLCAAADGGQILATELVRLTVGRHATHELVSVGALELKGLPAPVPTVEVRWEPAEETAKADAVPLPARLGTTISSGLFGFCGREPELTAMEQARKRVAAESRLGVVFVAGEPGVGKSALAARAAAHAHGQGGIALLGECADGSNVPYLPWIAALSHLVRHQAAGSLNEIKPVHAAALRRLLPAEADRFPPGEFVQSDPDTERFLLMESVLQLLELVSARSPVLVILDDLHWADASSLALLRHLIGAPERLSCLVVGTYRHSDLAADHPLTALLSDSHREHAVQRIDLVGLDQAEIVELMEFAAGYQLDDAGVGLAHALQRETDGNPFFVGEILRHLGESGAIAPDESGRYSLTGELDELALPRSVRDVVVRRVIRLGEEARRVLATASVLGRDFDVEVLAEVGEIGVDRLLDLMDTATNAAIVRESDEPNRYRFTHGLMQSALYGDLSAARRQRLHLRIAEILERTLGHRRPDPALLSELARHWQAATRPADAAKAVEYARRAGDAAMEALAPDDAARLFAQALELLERDEAADPRQRFELLSAIARAQLATDQISGRQTLKQAGSLAESIGDPELLVAWAATRVLGQSASDAADPDILRLLQRTLELIPKDGDIRRAKVLAAIVDETDPADWIARGRLADDAVAAADAARDDAVWLDVFQATSFMTSVDRVDDLGQRAARALRIAEERSDPASLATVLGWYETSCLVRGDMAEARRSVERLQHLAQEYGGVPVMKNMASSYRIGLLMCDGDLSELEREAQSLLELGLRGFPQSLAGYGGALFELRWAQGRLSEFADIFEMASEDLQSYAGYRPALVLSLLERGDVDASRAAFGRDAADGFMSFPRDTVWSSCMSLFAEAAEKLGDRNAAASLYELLGPFGHLHCATGPIYYGVIDRPLGRLAAFLNLPEEAEVRLRRALDTHRAVGAKYWAAATAADLAEVLVRSPSADRRAEAATLLDDIAETARAGGYGAVLRKIEVLRAAG